MKRLFAIFLCVIIMSAVFGFTAKSATGTSFSVNVTLTLHEDMVVPEEGLNIDVYWGKYSSGGSSGISGGGGGGWDGFLGYPEKLNYTYVPSVTQVNDIKKVSKIIEEKTVTVPYGQSSVSYSFEMDMTDSDISSAFKKDSFCIGYKLNNEYYMGGDYDRISAEDNYNLYLNGENLNDVNASLNISKYWDKKSISGKVVVPEHAGDLSYTILAEGNRETKYDEYGEYDYTTRDFVTVVNGEIPAGETMSDYSLDVSDGEIYSLSIWFSNGEYVRQYVNDVNVSDNAVVNFSNFKVPDKVTGKIQLPDKVSSYTDYMGEPLESMSLTVTLQSADEPYYSYIDSADLTIDADSDCVEFELTDELGAESAVVFFKGNTEAVGLILKGNYCGDDKPVCMSYRDAVLIKTDAKDIVLQCQKATKATVSLKSKPDSLNCFEGVSYMIPVQTENDEMYFDYGIFVQEDTEDDNVISEYALYIPEEYTEFIIGMNNYYVDKYIYYNGEGWTEQINQAYLFEVKNPGGQCSYDIGYDSYKPEIPIDVKYVWYDESEEQLNMSIINGWDNQCDSVKVFAMCKGVGNNKAYTDSNVEKADSYSENNAGIGIGKRDFDSSQSVKIIVLDDKMRPLSPAIEIK